MPSPKKECPECGGQCSAKSKRCRICTSRDPDLARRRGLSGRGKKRSPETVERMRSAQRRRQPEQNRRIADGLRGRKLTSEHVANTRKALVESGHWFNVGDVRARRDGYRHIKVAEGHGAADWKPEHRHVVEVAIGRQLSTQEHVHHLDGNRHNNSLCNLIVMDYGAHAFVTRLCRTLSRREDGAAIAAGIVATLSVRYGISHSTSSVSGLGKLYPPLLV